ncbi:C39 family peptidase [Butyrivibrio sp. NC2002]|uniref:C39 family peptidase n=1 Tax=Butyrivibrio sp. NC2002 TaxID=1410610 RepID=UPI000567E9E4|nr:C39 family peptidase [Butyrivibrio sp. NC2002]
MKKVIRIIIILVALILGVVAVLLIKLQIQTRQILTDYSTIYENEKYNTPVHVEGVEVITQDVSCGYACIEMFSAWNGGSLTEEDLYNEYGKVVTSTGDKFSEEMNKRFPEYTTTIHKYMKNADLIDAAYANLANGVPVPFEWAAKYGDVWTLHYSLLVGMDIPNNKISVANPYGYVEDISVDEFLQRTSFEAYENMPFYFKLAFAIGMFEKNTIFTVSPKS